MTKVSMIAVSVAGQKNLTRVTGVYPEADGTLESFARSVIKKDPDKSYYVYEHGTDNTQRRKGEPLYVWHVGEGFKHHEGWWVEW